MLEPWINDLLQNLSSKKANMNTSGMAFLFFFYFFEAGLYEMLFLCPYSAYYLQYTAVSTLPICGETGRG